VTSCFSFVLVVQRWTVLRMYCFVFQLCAGGLTMDCIMFHVCASGSVTYCLMFQLCAVV